MNQDEKSFSTRVYASPARIVRRRLKPSFPAFSEAFSVLDLKADPLFVISLYPMPDEQPLETLCIEVCGLDCNPRRITYADLTHLPKVRLRVPLICQIFNCSTEGVLWEGFRLVDFLDHFGLDTSSTGYFAFFSRDGHYFEGLSRTEARDPRVLLATGLNGGPLPHVHGGPVRLVVPFLQGYKSVKWLNAIRAYRNDPLGIKRLLSMSRAGQLANVWLRRYNIIPPPSSEGNRDERNSLTVVPTNSAQA